ncbi:hypothetical protein V8G54_024511, partial [Vigna mungo]
MCIHNSSSPYSCCRRIMHIHRFSLFKYIFGHPSLSFIIGPVVAFVVFFPIGCIRVVGGEPSHLLYVVVRLHCLLPMLMLLAHRWKKLLRIIVCMSLEAIVALACRSCTHVVVPAFLISSEME